MGNRKSRSTLLRLSRPWTAAVLAVTAGSLFAASPAFADVTSVSGGAFGESVNVTTLLGLSVKSGPTPTVTLPPTGHASAIHASLASVTVPGLLSTGILNASTQGTLGASGGSHSSASVDNLSGLAGALTATVVGSSCTVGPNSSSGTTTLTDVVLGGITLPLNPAPNDKITVPGVGTVTLNEQIPSGGAGDYSLTVNAIDVALSGPLGTGSIIIGQSRCGEAGPDVTIPFAPIGILGVSAVLGAVLVRSQRRRPNVDDTPPITG